MGGTDREGENRAPEPLRRRRTLFLPSTNEAMYAAVAVAVAAAAATGTMFYLFIANSIGVILDTPQPSRTSFSFLSLILSWRRCLSSLTAGDQNCTITLQIAHGTNKEKNEKEEGRKEGRKEKKKK